jgi:hypothetical protein
MFPEKPGPFEILRFEIGLRLILLLKPVAPQCVVNVAGIKGVQPDHLFPILVIR